MTADRHIPSQPAPNYRPFLAWLALFYAVWLGVVVSRDLGATAAAHWPIAAAMAAGSYFAGSTPMGGGTVGFPVLVLLFEGPASLGRDFSFAVQSIGMVSASILIFCRRQPIDFTILKWAALGSAVGTPLGVLVIAPIVPGVAAKLAFAVVWASFGVLHFWKLKEFCDQETRRLAPSKALRLCGLLVGSLGGATVASVTGVGVDMLLYAALVLAFRADLKMAIPTSVILMALTSLIGTATQAASGQFNPEVFGHWLAAAPIVAIGAPIGAFVVEHIDRRPTLMIVSGLCLGQLAWTLSKEWTRIGVAGAAATLAAVLGVALIFRWVYRLSHRRQRPAAAR